MKPPLPLAVLSVALLGLAGAGRADELPPPRVLPTTQPPPAIVIYPPTPYRVSRYAVWNYYGVSSTGQFLPRVLDTPYGAYYAFDGRSYPWVATHTYLYMPYAGD
jgi:hypothetical protein